MAQMKFQVAGVSGDYLVLPIAENLDESAYFTIADANKDEVHEYISIIVEFEGERDDLIILLA